MGSMVLGSGVGRQRTLRDLLSIGGIVGCVALGVAVIVAPAASNLGSIVPAGTPITAPRSLSRPGEVAVEVRPGVGERRATVTSLLPSDLVLALPAITDDRTSRERPVDRVPGLASAARPVPAVIVPAAAPPVAPPVAVVVPPVAVPADQLTAKGAAPSQAKKAKDKEPGKGTAAAAAPPVASPSARPEKDRPRDHVPAAEARPRDEHAARKHH